MIQSSAHGTDPQCFLSVQLFVITAASFAVASRGLRFNAGLHSEHLEAFPPSGPWARPEIGTSSRSKHYITRSPRNSMNELLRFIFTKVCIRMAGFRSSQNFRRHALVPSRCSGSPAAMRLCPSRLGFYLGMLSRLTVSTATSIKSFSGSASSTARLQMTGNES